LAFRAQQSDVLSVWKRGRQSMVRALSERERERLGEEIVGLQSLNLEQLKSRWRSLYGSEPPTRFTRDLLVRAIAYRIQERALGGLSIATRRLFERVADDAQARRPLKLAPVRRLEPGAVLIREWGGIKHQVTVLENGFSYGEINYRSLSE